jgi:zinc protease
VNVATAATRAFASDSGNGVAQPVPEEVTLGNGLHAVCQRDDRMPFVVLRLGVMAGARHDGSLPGLAHVCEHLACEGPPEAARSFAEGFYRAGGNTNGWTTHDHTTFADFVPAAETGRTFEIAAERLYGHGAWITDEDIRCHVNTIVREHQERSHPFAVTGEIECLQQLLYPIGDPYHWPAGGTPDALDRIRREDAVAFFTRRYSPSGVVVTIVGDVDPDRVFRDVERRLGAGISTCVEEPTRDPAPTPDEALQELTSAHVRYVRHYVAYRLPGYAHTGWASGTVFARAVALGRSSPLRRELVRQRIAHDIRVYIEPRRDATTVAFLATALPGVSRARLKAVFVDALERVIAGELRTLDIDRALKAELIARHIHSDKLVVRAEQLATRSMLRRWYGTPDDHDALQSRPPSSLLDEGRAMFTTMPRVHLSIGPSRV